MKTNKIYKNHKYEVVVPEISVVTPIYNRTKTIQRTIKSLENQTFKNFEYILVDDGSTDNIDEIILSYLENTSMPIIYMKKENGGVHTARNCAIKAARGEFIVFLDSDDELLVNSLHVFLETWKSIPKNEKHLYRGVVGQCVDQNNVRVGSRFPENINDVNWEEAVKLCDLTKGEHSTMMVASILKDNLWPEPNGITFVTEDIVWKKLQKEHKYKTYYINDIVRIYHRDTEESYSNSKIRNIQTVVNGQWNYGYRINNWDIYKKESKIKAIVIYGVFTEIARSQGKQYLSLSKISDIVFLLILKIPIKIIAKYYVQKKMKSD